MQYRSAPSFAAILLLAGIQGTARAEELNGDVPFPRSRLGVAGEAGAVGGPGLLNVSFVGLRGIAGVQLDRWVAIHGLLAIATSGLTSDVRGGAFVEYSPTHRFSMSFGFEGEGILTLCQTGAQKPSELCGLPAVSAPLVFSFHSMPREGDGRRKVFTGGIELRPTFITIGPPIPFFMGGSVYFGYDEM